MRYMTVLFHSSSITAQSRRSKKNCYKALSLQVRRALSWSGLHYVEAPAGSAFHREQRSCYIKRGCAIGVSSDLDDVFPSESDCLL